MTEENQSKESEKNKLLQEKVNSLKKQKPRAISIATSIKEKLRGYFTEEDWIKYFSEGLENPPESFITVVSFLSLHNLIKTNTSKSTKPMYKIILGREAQISNLEREEQEIDEAVRMLEERRVKIQNQIKTIRSDK